MKIQFFAVGIISSIALSGCNVELNGSPIQNIKPKTATSTSVGNGDLKISGAISESIKVDTKAGDKVICGPTQEGFQLYVGPAAEGSGYGLVISLQGEVDFPGTFVFSNDEPAHKFSFGLKNQAGVWLPNRDSKSCTLKVSSQENDRIQAVLDCPEMTDALREVDGEIKIESKFECNVVDMTDAK